ncbi:hypothetical protein EJD97_024739, partial [Solanum chilense]
HRESNHLAGLGVGEVGIREGRMLIISPRRNYIFKSPLQPLDSCGLHSKETRVRHSPREKILTTWRGAPS